MGRPGLVGTMARTAVVAGTATAVSGGMIRHQNRKDQAAADEQYAAQANEAEMAAMQAQLAQLQAQQAPPPPPPPAAAPAAAPAGDDMMGQLTKLADLHTAGILDDAEFAAAKAKLLG
jgi:hypothetical protein